MINVTRIFDFPHYQLNNNPLERALVSKEGGKWVYTSTQMYINQSNWLSSALLSRGVSKGDKIGVISNTNMTQWNISDIGITQIGAHTVPIYPTISEKEYLYIFNHAQISYCILSDKELFDKINRIIDKAPSIKEIICFKPVKGTTHWGDLLDYGKKNLDLKSIDKRKREVKPDDLATIIYTSGTTGTPKGVMLSHKNIVSNVLNCKQRIPLISHKNPRVLSFLPACHIFERMLLYLYQYKSYCIYFAESIEHITSNIKEVKPHLMAVVPRLIEKIFDSIIEKGSQLSGIKKKLFLWAIEIGKKYEPYGKNGIWYEFQLKIARKLIFNKWKQALGNELVTMVSGSAALHHELARLFCAAELYIMEGYGLTETSPVVSVNMLKNNFFRFKTVGKPISNVRVKVAKDGEILVKGDSVMLGYYKNSELTKSVIKEGYFHTGDKGYLDEDGFLKITGRKKEIFKTSGGKYITPVILENSIKQSPFVEQILVIGEGEKMPSALIQPNFEFIKKWSKNQNIPLSDIDSLDKICSNEKVINQIEKEIGIKNQSFGRWEQIKRIELTPEVWSVSNSLLTPTLKPKREVIIEHFKELYEKIYK